MKDLLARFAPCRAAEGAGGGAAGAAPPAGGAPPAAGAGSPAAGGAGGAGAGAPAAAPPAAAGAAPPAGGTPPAATPPAGPYRPEGLADTLFGENDQETIDKLAGALKGYRDRDATKGVPETADAYAKFDPEKLLGDLKLDVAVAPHLKELVDDPIMKAIGAFGLERKIPAADLQGVVAVAFAEAQKSGILDTVDPVKERAALLPEAAKSLPQAQQDAAIEARLQANEDFVKLLGQPGADGKPQLDPKVGEHALLMLMDTAQGNQFIEFFRSQMTGGDRAQPLPGAAGDKGSVASQREALRTRAALPENTFGDPKFNRASWDQLQADYRKLPAT
jgi:hypothetical protein